MNGNPQTYADRRAALDQAYQAGEITWEQRSELLQELADAQLIARRLTSPLSMFRP